MSTAQALFYFWWYSEDMLGRILVISFVAAIGLLGIIMRSTTPATINPLGIFFVFILMYISVVCILTFLLDKGSAMLARISSAVTVRRPIRALGLVRAYYFSSIVALAPVMLLGMQSVGEVSFYQVILVVLFVGIACMYISKRIS
jgi:hypothetical protein